MYELFIRTNKAVPTKQIIILSQGVFRARSYCVDRDQKTLWHSQQSNLHSKGKKAIDQNEEHNCIFHFFIFSNHLSL